MINSKRLVLSTVVLEWIKRMFVRATSTLIFTLGSLAALPGKAPDPQPSDLRDDTRYKGE